MPCYHPIKAYFSKKLNEETGKRSLVFNSDSALFPNPQFVPCGQCIGCRLQRSHEWAIRCMHEASLYDRNCFITLTFSDDYLGSGSLDKSDFQKFLKRLRKFISPLKVRYFHCGEYGPKLGRPHHHAILFGYDFDDKVVFKESGGVRTYTSAKLSELWPYGFSTLSDVTFDSCAYVARYVIKKWSKKDFVGKDLYDAMADFTDKKGFYSDKQPEYITMSLKPGIGEDWYKQYFSDVYPAGFVLINRDRKVKPPKFYDAKYELDFPFNSVMVKAERARRSLEKQYTQADLNDKEFIKLQSVKQIKRSYEDAD